MKNKKPNITIPVDLTNPGQFFACCGLLELADRLWPGAEGWFAHDHFMIAGPSLCSLTIMLEKLSASAVANTMTPVQIDRLVDLTAMKKRKEITPNQEEEKKELESLQRELPIVISGAVSFRVDWFVDEYSGGSRFKTWAGQQSVLNIATAMHDGMRGLSVESPSSLWTSVRGIGLPFNFDSDLGGQGSALDIGFSFDPLAGSETTRIEGTCKPAMELLCFIGLQRFRPREIPRENRFVYVAWSEPLGPCVASPVVSQAVPMSGPVFEFPLLYRTKYLKSFLPAQPYQGERDV